MGTFFVSLRKIVCANIRTIFYSHKKDRENNLYNTPMKLIDRLKEFIDYKGVSLNSFDETIGAGNGYVGKQIKRSASIGSDVLEKIFLAFPELNPTWLLTGSGSMLLPAGYTQLPPVPQSIPEPYGRRPLVVESRTEGLDAVPLTELSAAAGQGALNEEYFDAGEVIHVPSRFLKTGSHIAVRVKGDSMSPTLQDGGYVIIRNLHPADWDKFPNEQVAVVVNREGHAYLKRLKNRFRQGFITLMSDNPDKTSHPNFNLQRDEILTLWHVEWYLSAKMPNIHDQYYSRLQRLEDKYDDLERLLAHNK